MSESSLHRNFRGNQVHVPHSFEYANEAARLAAAGFISTDVGKLALQLDKMSFWVLSAASPAAWVGVGGALITSRGGVIVGDADGKAMELGGEPNQYLGWDADGNAVATTGGMPPGTRLMWPSDTPPVWGLVEDGGEYSRAVYASLFAVIGTIFGAGDGAASFNVPDSRNLFNRAAPAGGNVGVYQADAFASHRHSITASISTKTVSSGSNTGAQRPYSTTTAYSGDDETRPKNRHYLPIIVY